MQAHLAHYYKMEGNGNDSIGGQNLADTNISYSSSFGKINQGQSYPASEGYSVNSTMTQLSAATGFSVNFWIQYKSFAAHVMTPLVMDYKENGFRFMNHAFLSPTNTYYIDGATGGVNYSTVPSLNTWYMVTLTLSGGFLNFYINNSQVGTAAAITGSGTGTTSRASFGDDTGNLGGWTNIWLDEASFFKDYTLDSTDRGILYNSGAGFEIPPIVFGAAQSKPILQAVRRASYY